MNLQLEQSVLARCCDRFASFFQDHEIILRTQGRVRFLRITASWQKRLFIVVLLMFLLWVTMTIAVLVTRVLTAQERVVIDTQQKSVARSEKRIARYRDRVGEVAAELEDRQIHLEDLVNQHFGNMFSGYTTGTAEKGTDALAKNTSARTSARNSDSNKNNSRNNDRASMTDNVGNSKIIGAENSTLPPEARALEQLEARQNIFAVSLLKRVNARIARVEGAVSKLGMNPVTLLRRAARGGQGGPFIPYRVRGKAKLFGDSFAALENALFRMEVLERTLVAAPSDNPTNRFLVSSGFGYRRDPFTGRPAMHSGLDFRGEHGTPVFTTAPGSITYVGYRPGYGKTVDIDHGQGIMTRYAHLSGFLVRTGEKVEAGRRIGLMGSTGRSTSSHLHFEVRLHGQALNPRRFLEKNEDVLKIKQVAGHRVEALRSAR